MADTAFQRQYRQEFVVGFEQKQSMLRQTTTTEAVIKGNEAEFLVADSGNASTVTRGVNGNIPARADNLNQFTCTLSEEHDLVRKTGFNIFASQGDQRRIMQHTTMGTVNRKIDQQIIEQLNLGTVNTGASATAGIDLATRALSILGNAEVEYDGMICAVITPAFLSYLLRDNSFSSADYVGMKPLEGMNAAMGGMESMYGYYNWMGIKWMAHPRLPGRGTANEKCFMYHKSSIGHAANVMDMNMAVGYDEEQDYSFARASIYSGSKLLQNSGVVVMNHDGSALAAA
tara:strand:- start:10574 stop:11434 length:861 start_codon:yes stop_codon:yes gene_type:complete